MKDNFSAQANAYAKYRPDYPQALFDFILSHIPEKKLAWDCATGNGQAAKQLANHFETVYATDISQKQLDNAFEADNIFYSVQAAEQTDFPNNSFDLITVAQALHWFKFDDFFNEVKRVGKNGSWLAVWMYGRYITKEIDQLIHQKFYTETVGSYWDKERKHVDENYSTITFPFEEIKCPAFKIEFEWRLDELAGYLETWSAVQKYISKNGFSPVPAFINELRPLWVGEKMKVVFPLHLRMGKIEK